MAIYLNDKILRANTDGSKLEREYKEGLEKVDKFFNRFRMEGSSTSYIQIRRNAKNRKRSMTTKKLKKLPTIALPVVVNYYDDELGATTIRYATEPPQRNANGGVNWGTKYVQFNEVMSITENQKDLAWFLLFASNLIKKGVYQIVDTKAEYEGTFSEIILKKNVVDALTSKDNELIVHLAKKFISENVAKIDPVELAVRLHDFCEKNKKWEDVYKEIKTFNSANVLEKEAVSEIEYDGEPVSMSKCPVEIKAADLREQAKELGIKMTTPPQTKDVLYSLIQHIKEKQEIVLNE
jgi:hypothetical protein